MLCVPNGFICRINSLRPSDAIRSHRSGSILPQVIAWCLTASSHDLDRCRFLIHEVPWYLHEVFPGQCPCSYCVKLDISIARRRLKSPQSLSGTSAHPTMVTLVNIMVMNGWLTSFSFHVNRPSHSWDKAISDSDLEISTPRSRSWVWSKGKLAQYHINSLHFHLTSIRPTIPEKEVFRNLT